MRPTRRASNDPILPIDVRSYLRLLDWSGRQMRADKKGTIPADLAPILDRLGVKHESWLGCVQHFGRWFHHAVGKADRVLEKAAAIGRRWLQGATRCRETFG